MRLRSLELAGFKSFAKKTEMEFGASITAIVGPNGSGKSNIAEAFRFALGEQSMKSMRGKRTEDLIWNGSPTIPRSNRASVSLILDNRDKFLSVDFDEVSLSRIIHRDASNEYLINGSQARLKDISELVTGANIGSTGHHIISQGEADRILNVSPKDRKLMLEDALGLKIYHYRINESAKKLEKTNENLKEVESLRRELAPHLKFLKKQVERVERAKEMKVSLEKMYKEYFARESLYISSGKEKIEEEVGPLKLSLSKIEKELQDARERITEESVSGEILSAYSDTERELERLRGRKMELERAIGKTEGEIETLNRLIEREAKEASEKASVTVSAASIETLEDEILESVNGTSIQNLEGIKSVIRSIFDRFLSKVNAKEADEDSLQALKADLGTKKLEFGSLSVELENLKSKEIAVGEKLELLRKEKEEEKDSYKEAEKEVFRLQAQRSDMKAKVDDLTGRLSRLGLIEDEYKRDLAEAGALVGRGAVDFEEGEVMGENGEALSKEAILSENRESQIERKKAVERLKIRLEESGGAGGQEIIREYEETQKRDSYLEREVEDLVATEKRLNELIAELEKTLEDRFKKGIEIINKEFENFFSLMFGGGKASLDVVRKRLSKRKDTDLNIEEDEEDIEEEEGVEIKVSLPHKKIRGLEMLSGGERALTSIALLFAMSQVNPPPFVILDETDAALDEANSRKYGDMIEKLSQNSQLILITHNRETMSRAGVLYGVTMGSDGVSKLLSVKFEEAVKVAK